LHKNKPYFLDGTVQVKFSLINPPNKKIKSDIDKAVLLLGLAYLAAVLLKDNHDVKIIDAVIEEI